MFSNARHQFAFSCRHLETSLLDPVQLLIVFRSQKSGAQTGARRRPPVFYAGDGPSYIEETARNAILFTVPYRGTV
jgi:hypothetical protein